MQLMIYSKALFSTWIYYSPDRLLFDAGEGISSYMGNKIFAIKKIFLTHGHADHIAGLWGIINSRNNAMGDREKRLEIYFPKDSNAIREYFDFIKRVNSELKYELVFYPIDESDKILIKDNGNTKRFVVPFRVKHTMSEPAFGFNVVEERRKLKEEFLNLSKEKIVELIKKHGKECVTYSYEKKILTISGDTMALEPSIVEDTDLLLHECTFLNRKDRKGEIHASLDEVMELIQKTGVKNVVLYHISSRYESTADRIIKKVSNHFTDLNLEYVYPGKLWIR
ncbi:MAG: ribonuclease [Thermotogaceae bacterium]|nr:ribonuclease [Thermotogaceae bacterium]MDN5338449.1 ribonuclease [Thermotogaceae bacterium]